MEGEMLKQVKDRFTAEFGRPAKEIHYIVAWEPRLDVGLAVEREGAKTRSFAQVWVPHPGPGTPLPTNAIEYGSTEGRHSNAYSLPGLKKGMAALRFRIGTLVQLEELVRFIRALPPIRGAA
jgi:hypothetical protein